MSTYEVTDYQLFDNGKTVTNTMKDKVNTEKTNMSDNKTKLSDESVFMGPVCDICVTEFGKINERLTSTVDGYGKMSTFLTDVVTSYKNADKQAGERILVDVDTSGNLVIKTESLDPNLTRSESGYVFPFGKDTNYRISSHVGKRKAPTAGASTNHQGTDYAASSGTPIYSISDGEVITSGDFGGYGNCVRVKMDDGSIVYYGHCSKTTVPVGTRVKAGDQVGNVGSTGISTGPHLHLEIRAADYTNSNRHLLDSEELFADILKT